MHADLAASLVRLETDLRTAAIDRSALFWLRTFVDLAAGGDGSVRSDRWVEDGLAASARSCLAYQPPSWRRANAW